MNAPVFVLFRAGGDAWFVNRDHILSFRTRYRKTRVEFRGNPGSGCHFIEVDLPITEVKRLIESADQANQLP